MLTPPPSVPSVFSYSVATDSTDRRGLLDEGDPDPVYVGNESMPSSAEDPQVHVLQELCDDRLGPAGDRLVPVPELDRVEGVLQISIERPSHATTTGTDRSCWPR